MTEQLKVEKLVHGGQAIGTLKDGRRVFVWGALPGETVEVRIVKQKRSYAEAMVESVLTPSKERVEPKDESYLSTSPWQIMTFEAEHHYKHMILAESMQREGVDIPHDFEYVPALKQWRYRNKMEYSFWGDDAGLHLALFRRGSQNKHILKGSSIAMPEIDAAAEAIRDTLQRSGVRASQLKTVMIRASQSGRVVAALFVKDKAFPKITLPDQLQGLVIYYSHPKSPASVATKELHRRGVCELSDELSGHTITYGVESFFQVNVAEFQRALSEMENWTHEDQRIVDMYAGVGAIAIPLGANALVEVEAHNIHYAQKNAPAQTKVIHAFAEDAVKYIPHDGTLVVDPPRAGLHKDFVRGIMSELPARIIYLSCNPSTQARDIKLIQEAYSLTALHGYNFFPRTPHIESLALLELHA